MVDRSLNLPWILVLLISLLSGRAVAAESTTAEKPKDDRYELYKVFVDTLDQIERNYVKDVDRRELVEAAIQGMLDKLDPYSSYINPEKYKEFETSVENKFGGIGIRVNVVDGQLNITSPLVGSPAYRAGLLAGDHIIAIEGKTTKGITLDEAVHRLKGEAGTSVNITVTHRGDPKPHKVSLTREVINVETILGDSRKADDTWDFLIDPDRQIGYVRLTAFGRTSAGDLHKVIAQLQTDGMQGLILDLRFNPGGLLSAATEISDMFVADGRIVSTQGRNAKERIWDAHKEDTFDPFPMVVLINRYSASASEIVAACLQDHKRATLIGDRTFGKGSVQNVIRLEEGKSALKLTTAGYRRPSGKNIHRFPDLTESDDWGVRPNDNFAMRLDDAELSQLMRVRRDRDVVRSHEKPTPESPKSESPEKPKDDEGKSPADAEKDNPTEKRVEDSEFVDRQLRRALEHLTAELARAEE